MQLLDLFLFGKQAEILRSYSREREGAVVGGG